MSDNATAHKAADYEVEVSKTIPFHRVMIETAIDVALTVHPSPARWLDTGAGPGVLIERAIKRSPNTLFLAADPSAAMLDLARGRLSLPADQFLAVGSQDLPSMASLDVITAVQCHHYGDADARKRAVTRCHELLAPSGVLVVFENVRAETDEGHVLQRARWVEWQREQGRDAQTIEKHLAREGVAFFPVRPSEHDALLHQVGFRTVEVIWRAYGQAGFLALR